MTRPLTEKVCNCRPKLDVNVVCFTSLADFDNRRFRVLNYIRVKNLLVVRTRLTCNPSVKASSLRPVATL